MLYTLEQGPTEGKIIEQCMRRGLPLPDAIQNAPELGFGLSFYYTAFLSLNTSRGGMGDGRIPWHIVQQYAEVHNLTSQEAFELHEIIASLDSNYLVWKREKAPKHGKS